MRLLIVLILAAALITAAGCSSNPTSTARGTVRLQLTDAPAGYDAVNLVVTEVSIHQATADSTSGWEVLRSDTVTYDLLQLRNGVFTTLAQAIVPAGHYTQIRLKLGAGSNVVVDGVTQPLVVPSGLQTGYKLVGEFDVPANGLLDLALDFDAERSVVLTGSGTYLLKPTARVLPFSTAGAISGHLLPEGTAADVWAILGADTLGHAQPGSDGRFTVAALPAGSYSVAVHPGAGYRDTTIAGVSVVEKQTTDLGDIQLTPQ